MRYVAYICQWSEYLQYDQYKTSIGYSIGYSITRNVFRYMQYAQVCIATTNKE